jgi:tetratricopeptide (TPR) repeat protein
VGAIAIVAVGGCGGRVRSPALTPLPDFHATAASPAVERAIDEGRRRIDDLDSAAAPSDDRAEAYLALGIVAHGNGLNSVAEVCYRNAATLDRTRAAAPYLLAVLTLDGGHPDDGAQWAAAAIALEPDSEPTVVLASRIAVDRGRLDEARRVVDDFLRFHPDSAGALVQRGRVAAVAGDDGQARADYERALELQPQATRIWAELAPVARRLGDDDVARHAVDVAGNRGVAIDDPWLSRVQDATLSPDELASRATLAFERGDAVSAERDYARAVEVSPDDAELRSDWGAALARLGREADARRELETAVQLDPDLASAYFNLGVLDARVGDEVAMGAAYRKAIEIDPDHAGARFNLANAAFRSGDLDEALHHLDRILKAEPTRVDAERLLARVLFQHGRFADARRRLEALLVARPDARNATADLVGLLAVAPLKDGGDPRRALEISSSMVRPGMDLAEVEALAKAQAANHDFANAVATQRRALDAVTAAGRDGLVAAVSSELARFERGEVSATLWR